MKVIVGQPITKPWQWVVNEVEDGQTTTIRIFTGPRAQRLAELFGKERARVKKAELEIQS